MENPMQIVIYLAILGAAILAWAAFNALRKTELYKQHAARLALLSETVLNFVYEAEVLGKGDGLESYAQQEQETGYNRKLLYVFDRIEAVLANKGVKVNLLEVKAIVERILVQNPDFTNKL